MDGGLLLWICGESAVDRAVRGGELKLLMERGIARTYSLACVTEK